MFTPKYPPTDTAPTASSTAPATTTSASVAPVPVSNRPTIQLTPGSTLALVGGGTAVVLIVGTVLVSLLLAVAITGVSVAVTAVVLRSLLNDSRNGR